MVARCFRTLSLAMVLLALGSSPSIVQAQVNPFNPYGNSGYQDYREFSRPSTSNNPALPGQARLDGEPTITRPRANSFRQYLEEDDAVSTSRPGQSYQQQNKQYNRVYKSNDTAQNQEFLDRMKQRDLAYAKAMQEKDPVKRSRLLRQIENDSAASSSAKAKPSSTATSKAPDPNARSGAGTTARAPAPTPPGTGSRRSTAPPPAGGTARRANPASTAPPVPGVTTSKPSTATGPKSTAPDPSTIAVPAPPR